MFSYSPPLYGLDLAASSLSIEQPTHQIRIFPIWREGCHILEVSEITSTLLAHVPHPLSQHHLPPSLVPITLNEESKEHHMRKTNKQKKKKRKEKETTTKKERNPKS